MRMNNISIRLKILLSFGSVLLVLMGILVFAHIRLVSIEEDAATLEGEEIAGGSEIGELGHALGTGFAQTVNYLLDPNERTRSALEATLERETGDRFPILSGKGSLEVDTSFGEAIRTLTAAVASLREAEAAALRIKPDIMPLEARANFINDRLTSAFNNAVNSANLLSTAAREQRAAAARRVEHHTHSIRVGLGASIVVALVMAAAAAAHLFHAINVPLRQLLSNMKLMQEGDFSQRMPTNRGDEFGKLAAGFNSMAEEVMGLVGQVQKSGVRVNTSMTEIAATSKEQQATASEIAATTTEIGATSREISATSKELVRTMNEVSAVAENAAGVASIGQTGLAQMSETMRQVMEAASGINAKLAVLNEKAGNINQVVTTITKVADQTNLLSLNAAIEAEKAGEYGRGFAVVSSEIRRLADQTAVATLDIEEMVKEIQSAVSAGVMGMDKFSEEVRRGMLNVQDIGGKLSEVISLVQTLVPRFEAVNDGMQAQATAAEQISEALLQLMETTQQTAESLRQSNSAIDELNRVSGNLHGSISRFRLAA